MESLARCGIGVCFAAGTLIFPVFSAELDKRKESATTLMDVLTSPFLWLMSLGYFVVFCAKTSTIDWGQLYLMKDLKRSQFAGTYTCVYFLRCQCYCCITSVSGTSLGKEISLQVFLRHIWEEIKHARTTRNSCSRSYEIVKFIMKKTERVTDQLRVCDNQPIC